MLKEGHGIDGSKFESLEAHLVKYQEDYMESKTTSGVKKPRLYLKRQFKNELTRPLFEVLLIKMKSQLLRKLS